MKRILTAIIVIFLCIGFLGITGERSSSIDVPENVEPIVTSSRGGPTYVKELIENDTTWTAANSPYIIIDNTTLKHDATLNIEAGTVVKFRNWTTFTIKGKLNVKGTSDNRVVFTGLEPFYKYQLGNPTFPQTFYNGTGIRYNIIGGIVNISYAIIEYCSDRAFSGSGTITDTIFAKNKDAMIHSSGMVRRCTFRDNYNGIKESGSEGLDIYDSIFQNNKYTGIYGENGIIVNCTVNGSYRGASLTSTECYNGTFFDNFYGVSVYRYGILQYSNIHDNDVGVRVVNTGANNPTIIKNSVHNNTCGIILERYENGILKYNNIFNNTEYDLNYTYGANTNVSHNWWGTTNTSEIDENIIDVYDYHNRGEVFYQPILTKPEDLTNTAPVASAGLDHNVNVNYSVLLDGSGSYDPDGDTLYYKWTFGDGTPSPGWRNEPNCNITHRYAQPGTYTATIAVRDGHLTDTDTCIVIVYEQGGNKAPVADAGPDKSVLVNTTVFFNGSGSYDPNNDPLTYYWLFGDGYSTDWQSEDTTSHMYTTPGTYAVTLKVSDGAITMLDSCVVYVSKPGDNRAPVANAGSNQDVKVNQTVNFDGSASYDPDSDQLNYHWDFGDGVNTSWLTLNSASHVYSKSGTYNVTLTVSDGNLTDDDICTITVKDSEGPRANHLPKFISTPDLNASVSVEWTYTPQAEDEDENDTVAIKLVFGPTGMAMTSGILKWTPTAAQVGANNVILKAEDGLGSVFQIFNITVEGEVEQNDTPEDQNKTRPKVFSSEPEMHSKNVSITDNEIVITFTKPMNRTSVESALSISPQTEYTIYWGEDDTELLIVFKNNLEYNTIYTIGIAVTSTDIFNNLLESPFELSFTTEVEDDTIDDGDNGDTPGDAPDGGDVEEKADENYLMKSSGMIGIVIAILIVIILTFIVIIKNRSKRKEDRDMDQGDADFDGRQEISGGSMSEEFTVTDEVINGSDELIAELKEEALEVKKPSDFGLSEDEMLNKIKTQYDNGEITRETYDNIQDILAKDER